MAITSDPVHDAVSLCDLLRRGPLGLTEAARLFQDLGLPQTATSQEIALRALDRAIRYGVARGWLECHDGVLYLACGQV